MRRIPPARPCSGRYFGGAIHPLRLFLGALVPTTVAILIFRLT